LQASIAALQAALPAQATAQATALTALTTRIGAVEGAVTTAQNALQAGLAQAQTQAQAQAQAQKPTQAQQAEILANKPGNATTQCGRDKYGYLQNSNNVTYGKCTGDHECCSGWIGRNYYGWCGRGSAYCYDDQQTGYGKNT
jgi:hypothetical protein